MSAAHTTELHAALTSALASAAAAGQFRLMVLADPSGLPWATFGEAAAPDHLAALPALIARAFDDRQMLLRFFSEKTMRFEYRSDALSYIKSSVEAAPAGAVYDLDVPADKEGRDAAEFVLNWDDMHLVLRRFNVGDGTWSVLGVSSNPAGARTALLKAVGPLAGILASPPQPSAASGHLAELNLHAKMTAALQAFSAAAPDIQMAAVTSKDGFVVTALDGGTMDAEVAAPLMGHAFLAIQESTGVLCGNTESVMLRMEEGTLLFRELTQDLLFGALLSPTACTGLISTAFETAAAELRCALQEMESAVNVLQEPLEVPA